MEYGWGGARHLYDGEITHEACAFSDCVHWGLRVETNKVPGAVRAAHVSQEEAAVAKTNPSGFISREQRAAVRESVKQKLEQEVRDGKHRKTRIVPILWDLINGTVYANATGATLEKLMEIFERSFGCALHPLAAGEVASQHAQDAAPRRALDDARPTRFVYGPDGEGAWPDYPWVAKGPQPKDFLGNEFLTWLWHEADGRTSVVKTAVGDVTVMFDKGLDLECAYGQTGKDSIRTVGPSHTPEARDALRVGKVPRRAGIVLDAFKQQFSLTLQAETLGVGGARLPEVEEADTPRKLFEGRITLLRDLSATIDGLFGAFLSMRLSPAWQGATASIRQWIEKTAAKAAEPAAEITREQLKATRDLCPKPGGDVEAVTLSSGGRTVTLTAETRKNINRELAETK